MTWNREQSAAQIDALESELTAEIMDLSHEPLTAAAHAQLIQALDDLFRLLPQRFDLKEADGYLSDVVEEFPEHRRHVEQLRIEQALLYEDLREIRERLRDVSNLGAAQTWISASLHEWIARLQHHEEQEARLSDQASHVHG